MSLIKRSVLLLNKHYEPLTITTVKRAMTLVSKGAALVVVPTDKQMCPGVYAPSVIKLIHYAKVPYRMQQVSRRNILMRDSHKCMYCGMKGHSSELELEHIIPRSRGGKSSWDNLVASCRPCNQKKKDRTPEEAGMILIRRPLPQSLHTHRFVLKTLGSEVRDWDRFLYNDNKGDQRFTAVGA